MTDSTLEPGCQVTVTYGPWRDAVGMLVEAMAPGWWAVKIGRWEFAIRASEITVMADLPRDGGS